MDGPSLLEILKAMPTGDPWDDAELWAVYEYIRGSKRLHVPEVWRSVLFEYPS